MSRWLDLQDHAHRAFEVRLAAVEDWSAPTPDTEWDTRALVLHVIREQQRAHILLAGGDDSPIRLEPVASDLRSEWRRVTDQVRDAARAVDPAAVLQLGRDAVSALEMVQEQVADVTVHTWDLARATGSDERLEDELVAAVWELFAPQEETLRASGLYAAPVLVDETAPLQSRLLAITGRDDRLAA
ncbi:TIGR03086 family protein [Rathayibacter iranicus]|uniref:TIGR03086 family protein n=2 Tax=Rathayibacter iranicus TaxID=59737 RepID=A0AAD1AHC3_9MICO|nr:TIGR03086 family protein [Rathayibacter iranicus]MWV30956.1 TIGR03086 family protein [Rathayibacter iranicus NCPPB 2253 = VKM Ac-1602]PPI48365.1 TIGR03086 family protein [Rathayibacter iranicus]PPI61445.1 TIGR03086 family protein [Rathayibacter iranicus]PPI72802.1 TIGR03086 family protein [Rathayibacter iranicus]